MVSCSELEDEDVEEDVQAVVQEAAAPNTDDKIIAILKGLPEHMSWKQIFHLPEELREQVVVTLHHAMLFVDKVKAVKEPAKLPTQCAYLQHGGVIYRGIFIAWVQTPQSFVCLSLAILGGKKLSASW